MKENKRTKDPRTAKIVAIFGTIPAISITTPRRVTVIPIIVLIRGSRKVFRAQTAPRRPTTNEITQEIANWIPNEPVRATAVTKAKTARTAPIISIRAIPPENLPRVPELTDNILIIKVRSI